jgi:membrane-bound lytic murein transglycosylase B
MRYSFLISCAFALFSQTAAFADNVIHNDKPFGMWLGELREQARAQGISEKTIQAALTDIELDDSIITLDRKQPEGTITLAKYLKNTVAPLRIRQGREMMQEYESKLARIGKEYGVQPRFIVALWGIETNYGANTGGFDVVPALATLAYEGRRSEFFRGELLNALKIIDQDHIAADAMQGSWAGAMGQCQFMPSTFLKFAVDYNKDGRHDIWNDEGDVFASIANYLRSLGWRENEGWGQPVNVPAGTDASLFDLTKVKTISQWKQLGIKQAGGKPLPDSEIEASLIKVGEGDAAADYLVYHNFKALLQWNRSRFFATAVGNLADRVNE